MTSNIDIRQMLFVTLFVRHNCWTLKMLLIMLICFFSVIVLKEFYSVGSLL